jgi:hypothetical protein
MSVQLQVRNRWEEKRNYFRIACNLTAELAVGSKVFGFLFTRSARFQVQIKDRSTAGMRVVSEQHIPCGASVEMRVKINTEGISQVIKLHGRVVSSTTNDSNQCVAGIQLRTRPTREMDLWIHDVAESIRRMTGH